MPYTLSQELKYYYDTLAFTEDEIDHLLFCDHPPADYLDQIHEKNIIAEDLKWLIRDIKVNLASNELNKLYI